MVCNAVHPRIIGEFDDGALMKAFGQSGAGAFVAPTAIADYVCRQYQVSVLGQIEDVTEELYAITTERQIRHPAIVTMRDNAGRHVFNSDRRVAGTPAGRQRGKRAATRRGARKTAQRAV
jgi:DNA-binding transcriptional LysR family regulator